MIAALLLLLIGMALTAAIIAANGYFVAQEFAYMSVARARLRARAAEGDAAARRALSITRRMREQSVQLAVVDSGGGMLGIVTLTDLVRRMLPADGTPITGRGAGGS